MVDMTNLTNMTTEAKLKAIPGFIAILLIAIVAIFTSGDVGMIGVTILFSLLVSFTPYSIYKYLRSKELSSYEKQFPNFLRDLVEAKKSGMTLPKAVESASKNDYGKLNPHIKQMKRQLGLDTPFEEVMKRFRDKMDGSKLIQRSIRIIIEAKKSGGDVVSTMETIASDASTIKEMERERESKMKQHSMVMYLIYFMFLGITLLLSRVLVPMVEMEGLTTDPGDQAIGGGMDIATGSQLCVPLEEKEGIEYGICSLFLSISDVFGLGVGMDGYYKGIFLSMIIVQGIFSGLIIGQISESSPAAGVKHSILLTGIGFTAFIISASIGLI